MIIILLLYMSGSVTILISLFGSFSREDYHFPHSDMIPHIHSKVGHMILSIVDKG